jgi:hypothetical protein
MLRNENARQDGEAQKTRAGLSSPGLGEKDYRVGAGNGQNAVSKGLATTSTLDRFE